MKQLTYSQQFYEYWKFIVSPTLSSPLSRRRCGVACVWWLRNTNTDSRYDILAALAIASCSSTMLGAALSLLIVCSAFYTKCKYCAMNFSSSFRIAHSLLTSSLVYFPGHCWHECKCICRIRQAREMIVRSVLSPVCVRRILSFFRADAQTSETEKSRFPTRQSKLACTRCDRRGASNATNPFDILFKLFYFLLFCRQTNFRDVRLNVSFKV